jgi:hypothetical protein
MKGWKLVNGWKPSARVYDFDVDHDGSAYLFHGDKILKVDHNNLTFGPDTLTDLDFKTAYLNYALQILFTSTHILTRYANGFVIYDKATLKKVYEYRGNNTPLALTLNDGFVVFYEGNNPIQGGDKFFVQQASPFAGVAGKVKDIVPEAGTNQVLAATDKGLFELTPNANINPLKTADELPSAFFNNKSIRSIYRTKNGKTYIGTYQGFYIVDKDKIKLLDKEVVYCVGQPDDDTLLLGTEGGTGFAVLDIKTDRIRLINNAVPSFVYCMAKDGDSYLAGATFDLYRLKKRADNQWHANLLSHSDSLGQTKQIAHIDGAWYVASTTGLFKFNQNNTLKKIFPVNEKLTIYAVLADGNNLWLGTAAHGLLKITPNGKILNQIKFNNGLAGDFVYSLFKTNNLLFAGTEGGLSVFDMNAGLQSITPPDDKQYSEELNHSAIFYDGDHRQLILGGVDGLLLPDMEHYSSAKMQVADTVRLSYVKKGPNGEAPTKTNLFAYLQKEIVFDPGYVFMGLKFSGSNIWRQGDFLFRLREKDTVWHKSSLSNEISFYGLAPGRYTLQARFSSDANPRHWLTKTIVVVPHYYQTFLFKLLMAFVLASIIYAIWLNRVNKIRNEHLLRTTIASDLHDEIGSALTRISLSSELMNIKQQLDAGVVERISVDSKSAIASISDIIWSVDARNDNKDDLILRMKEHAYNMLDEIAEMNFEVHGLEKVVNLPQLTRQNIYLVFKEAINNIAKHNVNPHVWIILNNQLNGMTITIKNTINKRQKPVYAGQGLKNMQMRVKRMRATLDIVNDDSLFSVTIKMKRW